MYVPTCKGWGSDFEKSKNCPDPSLDVLTGGNVDLGQNFITSDMNVYDVYMMCIWCVCDVYMMCICYICYIICVPSRFFGCVEATSSTNSIVKWSGSVGRRRVRWIPLLQVATFPHTPMKIGPVFPLNKPRSSKSKIPSLERNTEKGHLCQKRKC